MRSTCGVRRRDDQHFGLGDWTELEGKETTEEVGGPGGKQAELEL